MIKLFLSYLTIICLAITLSVATPAPTDPYGDTVWKAGDKVTIKWTNDGKPISSICIKLMTGPDLQQIPLVTVVSGLSKNNTSFPWVAPSPKSLGYPSGKIYFLMFSDSAKPDVGLSWTTRFTILENGSASTVSYNTGQSWTIKPTGENSTKTTETTETTTTTTPEETSTEETSTTESTTDAITTTEVQVTTAPETPEETQKPQTTQNTQNPFDSKGSKLNSGWNIIILIIMISTLILI